MIEELKEKSPTGKFVFLVKCHCCDNKVTHHSLSYDHCVKTLTRHKWGYHCVNKDRDPTKEKAIAWNYCPTCWKSRGYLITEFKERYGRKPVNKEDHEFINTALKRKVEDKKRMSIESKRQRSLELGKVMEHVENMYNSLPDRYPKKIDKVYRLHKGQWLLEQSDGTWRVDE